jgi:hypothetical protein
MGQCTVRRTFVRLESSDGLTEIHWQNQYPAEIPWKRDSRRYAAELADFPEELRFIGARFGRFQVFDSDGSLSYTAYHLILPHWMLLLMTLVLPVTAVIRRSRLKRSTTLCASCGYDLRATPARCPECGTVPLTKGTT